MLVALMKIGYGTKYWHTKTLKIYSKSVEQRQLEVYPSYPSQHQAYVTRVNMESKLGQVSKERNNPQPQNLWN